MLYQKSLFLSYFHILLFCLYLIGCFTKGIKERNSLPTFSIGWSFSRLLIALNRGLFAWFSRIQSLANSPDCTSSRISFICSFVSSFITCVPVTMSSHCAVSEFDY